MQEVGGALVATPGRQGSGTGGALAATQGKGGHATTSQLGGATQRPKGTTEAFAATQGKRKTRCLPCKSMVEHDGHAYVVDSQFTTNEYWQSVFSERLLMLGKRKLTQNAQLSQEDQAEVQKKLFEAWKSEPTVKTTMETLRTQRKLNSEQVNRELRSRWKTAQHVRFGGALWVNIVIAIGKVDHLVVELVNEYIRQQVDKGEQRKASHDPQPGRKAAMKKQRRAPGIQHTKSPAKMARERARLAEKTLQRAVDNKQRTKIATYTAIVQDPIAAESDVQSICP